MKKIISAFLFLMLVIGANAQDYESHTWADICSGGMGDTWYGSNEAKSVADTLVSVQKTNGGWMKNDQFHKLTTSELKARQALYGDDGRNAHSCFDNYATTQEMRFLARVYQKTKVTRYLDSFKKALNLIFTSGNSLKGGWAQYWPLSTDQYSYQNYITFNDDLMTNMMKILQEVNEEKGDFKGLVDAETREKCKTQFDMALECVINCQIDDNGVKAAWCAQHDAKDFLPVEGRPHEMPSVSGYESASLLSYLMTLPKPSPELQECITSAITWLENHKYMENAAIADYTNAKGEADRHIIDKQGSNLWGRFIQIGGESGKAVYNKFLAKLKARGKKRSHHTTGFSYYEWQILEESYDESKAYQPIYAIYSNDYPELFYRHLYNYDDTPDATDKHGQQVATSLMAGNRRSYQYLGSWCDGPISAYKAWKARVDIENATGDYTTYDLSQSTYNGSATSGSTTTYKFADGFSVSNEKGKGYGAGKENTVKYSAGVPYTITIPEGLTVGRVTITGYDNYDADAYLASLNGTDYTTTDYVFPAKVSEPNIVTHTIDLAKPAVGTLPFSIGNKQCCLIITLYCSEAHNDLPGDVNGDSAVDVSDINAIISVICGSETNAKADINNDGTVDVSDINAVISLICGQ